MLTLACVALFAVFALITPYACMCNFTTQSSCTFPIIIFTFITLRLFNFTFQSVRVAVLKIRKTMIRSFDSESIGSHTCVRNTAIAHVLPSFLFVLWAHLTLAFHTWFTDCSFFKFLNTSHGSMFVFVTKWMGVASVWFRCFWSCVI